MTKHKNEMLGDCREKPFPCSVTGCCKGFETRKLLNNHKLKVHKIKSEHPVMVDADDEKKMKLCCPQCPKWFSVQIKLDGHIRGKHEGLKVRWMGHLFIESFFFYFNILSSFQPYKCPQKDCGREFSKYRSYAHHLRFRHGTVEYNKHKCSYDGCDKEYGVIDSLRTHIKRCHLGIVPVKTNQKLICEQCGRSFKNGFNLKVWKMLFLPVFKWCRDVTGLLLWPIVHSPLLV